MDYEDIYTEGITKITVEDVKYAKGIGMSIKLLATSKREDGKFYAMVSPVLVGQDSPLYSVNGVFNAIFIHAMCWAMPCLRQRRRQASHCKRGVWRCG